MTKLTIVGAGLTGCLLAIYLAKQGYEIDIFERRTDMRLDTQDVGRSINLSLSARGIRALAQADLIDVVLAQGVPIHGRLMHDLTGETQYQAYGRHEQEHNYAISRACLNIVLLNELSNYDNVKLYFQHKVSALDLENNILSFQCGIDNSAKQYSFEHILGCDGAYSVLRQALKEQGKIDFSLNHLEQGYKEIIFSADCARDLEDNYLHIWPRHDFMLMGLSNPDKSMTGTLFLNEHGDTSFECLQDESSVKDFFQQYFPDTVALLPDLWQQFHLHPQGSLAYVETSPWYYQDKILLLGDAAHAMVPFLGQGMNCGFEDVRLFNQCLEQHNGQWKGLFSAFYQQRKKDADAISNLSYLNNFEMRDHVASPRFLLQKDIEQAFMKRYPQQYISKYIMISYTHIPYDTAMQCGKLQQVILDKLTEQATSLEQVDWQLAENLLQTYFSDYQLMRHS